FVSFLFVEPVVGTPRYCGHLRSHRLGNSYPVGHCSNAPGDRFLKPHCDRHCQYWSGGTSYWCHRLASNLVGLWCPSSHRCAVVLRLPTCTSQRRCRFARCRQRSRGSSSWTVNVAHAGAL